MLDNITSRQGKHEAPSKGWFLGDRIYDMFKFMALIALPALGSAYFGLAGIWGLPNADKVVGTIVVLDTFLGVLLRLSKQQYDASASKYDGIMIVGEGKNSLVLNDTFENLETKNELLFKVTPTE